MERIIAFFARPWWTMFKMSIASMLGKPYLKVFLFRTRDGSMGIDAHYNIHFLYDLDNRYERAGAEHYDRNLEDQAKVAIYLYDNLASIAENYMPQPDLQDLLEEMGEDAPPLAFRGGEAVRQVVDLGKPGGGKSTLDVEMG